LFPALHREVAFTIPSFCTGICTKFLLSKDNLHSIISVLFFCESNILFDVFDNAEVVILSNRLSYLTSSNFLSSIIVLWVDSMILYFDSSSLYLDCRSLYFDSSSILILFLLHVVTCVVSIDLYKNISWHILHLNSPLGTIPCLSRHFLVLFWWFCKDHSVDNIALQYLHL